MKMDEQGTQGEQTSPAATWLDLYDWRQRVARLYAERAAALSAGDDPAAVLQRFRAGKDALFAQHPQSPLDAAGRAAFTGLNYFPYDAALRVEAELTPAAEVQGQETVQAPSSGPHAMPLTRAGRVTFTVAGTPAELTVYWIDVYGGGLFLPFRDATCPAESYGAGRYLFDTVKGSDFARMEGDTGDVGDSTMGYTGGHIVLDFNYAYNPSCAYDMRWVCPLAPRENWLTLPLRAGERNYDH
jgi:uncharacterized protein